MCDVWHINDGYVTDSVHETATASLLAGLLASGIPVYSNWGEPSDGSDILNELRAQGELDDYERGSFDFEDYLTDTITENFYDVELIEYSTEKYDHKRGFTTLTAEVQIPYENFVKVRPFIAGWNISVETDNGTLSFDA